MNEQKHTLHKILRDLDNFCKVINVCYRAKKNNQQLPELSENHLFPKNMTGTHQIPVSKFNTTLPHRSKNISTSPTPINDQSRFYQSIRKKPELSNCLGFQKSDYENRNMLILKTQINNNASQTNIASTQYYNLRNSHPQRKKEYTRSGPKRRQMSHERTNSKILEKYKNDNALPI